MEKTFQSETSSGILTAQSHGALGSHAQDTPQHPVRQKHPTKVRNPALSCIYSNHKSWPASCKANWRIRKISFSPLEPTP